MDILITELEQTADFSVKPLSEKVSTEQLELLPVSKSFAGAISNLVGELPSMSTALSSSNLYSVSFPEGLPHTLTELKQGGFGSMIKNPDTGRYAGSASFYKTDVSKQILLLSAFSAMALVTGQYYLTEINKDLSLISQKIDKILEFLYGEKKAELLAEINFTNYAHKNYVSIMQNEAQRIATITNLQEARKVAMKDIEFYLNDIGSIVNKERANLKELISTTEKALRTNDTIAMSIQLYIASNILEVWYSQNSDTDYLAYIENDIANYVEKCDKQILAVFTYLKGKIIEHKPQLSSALLKSDDKADVLSKIESQIEAIHSSNIMKKHKEIHESLYSIVKPLECVIDEEGKIYRFKTA